MEDYQGVVWGRLPQPPPLVSLTGVRRKTRGEQAERQGRQGGPREALGIKRGRTKERKMTGEYRDE